MNRLLVRRPGRNRRAGGKKDDEVERMNRHLVRRPGGKRRPGGRKMESTKRNEITSRSHCMN
jgi:hypothetical protein